MALEKGTEEWMFWSDLFQLCKKYWDVQETDEYWTNLMDESEKLNEKYKSIVSEKFILAFLSIQTEKYKLMIKK